MKVSEEIKRILEMECIGTQLVATAGGWQSGFTVQQQTVFQHTQNPHSHA